MKNVQLDTNDSYFKICFVGDVNLFIFTITTDEENMKVDVLLVLSMVYFSSLYISSSISVSFMFIWFLEIFFDSLPCHLHRILLCSSGSLLDVGPKVWLLDVRILRQKMECLISGVMTGYFEN